MSTHLEVQPDGTIDVSWHDIHRGLTIMGFTQIPNETEGFLTYRTNHNEMKLTVQKENMLSVDYFHQLLNIIQLPPDVFVRFAFSGVQ
jgi:hypothetical protein